MFFPIDVIGKDSAFNRDQYTDAYAPGIERLFWHVARNATILRWLRRCGMDAEKLLEIGCGPGIVVDYLRAKGVDCIGCDLASPSVPDRLADVIFASTDFRSLPLAVRSNIDGVLLCDVMEHLDDPVGFLRSLPESLPSSTRALITVPARNELWSAWDNRYGHFRRYDLDMLRAELEAAGLTLIASRYFFQSLYLPMRLAKRSRGGVIEPPTTAWPHRIIGAAMGLEQRISPARVPGASIIAVAAHFR